MDSKNDMMTEYLRIVSMLERSPHRDLLDRLFEMAELKFSPAMHTLSVCFEKGIVLRQDDKAAFEYCQAAARLKNPAALHNMGCNFLAGKHVARDPYKALACFKSAAMGGYVMSGHCLAWLHDNGDDGVERNGEAARLAYEWTFKNGYAKSANNLGVFYINGRHVAPDPTKAEEWFNNGAATGDEYARQNLLRLNDLKRRQGQNLLREIRSYANLWLDCPIF